MSRKLVNVSFACFYERVANSAGEMPQLQDSSNCPLPPTPSLRNFSLFGYEDMRTIVAKICLFLALPLGGPALTTIAYVMLGVWALLGPRRAIEALTFSWMLTFLNPSLYETNAATDVFRWLVILAAFVTAVDFFLRTRSGFPLAWLKVMYFVVAAGVLSIATSYALDVSLFKLTSFAVAVSAILWNFHFSRHLAKYWERWFLTLYAVIVFAGSPLLAMSAGYARNERGFQGLLNHPQAYGVFLSPFVAWLVCLALFRKSSPFSTKLLIAVGGISMVATQCRTAALATSAGVAFACLYATFQNRALVIRLLKPLIASLPFLMLAIVWGVLNFDQLSEGIEGFVLKDKNKSNVVQAFESSRGDLIERSKKNFLDNPLIGIGFGVASDSSSFVIRRDPVLGLPVGASIEKGFLIVAILEEVGLVGAFFTIVMVFGIYQPIFRYKAAVPQAALALSALFVNFGESIFFSLGGMGMLTWLLFGAAQVMSAMEAEWDL